MDHPFWGVLTEAEVQRREDDRAQCEVKQKAEVNIFKDILAKCDAGEIISQSEKLAAMKFHEPGLTRVDEEEWILHLRLWRSNLKHVEQQLEEQEDLKKQKAFEEECGCSPMTFWQWEQERLHRAIRSALRPFYEERGIVLDWM